MTRRFALPCNLLSSLRRHVSRPTLQRPSQSLPETKPNTRNRSSTYREILFWVFAFAQGHLIYHITQPYAIEVSACAGPSMVPTLSATGDSIAIDKRYRHGRGVVVGDIVDFVHPMVPGVSAVKRVVGMPGDFVISNHVEGAEGYKRELILHQGGDGIWVVGEKAEGKVIEESVTGRRKEQRMIQVPEGHCWLLGDNLSESRDSRLYGPLPLALIKGKVIARVFPWKERAWLVNNLESVDPET